MNDMTTQEETIAKWEKVRLQTNLYAMRMTERTISCSYCRKYNPIAGGDGNCPLATEECNRGSNCCNGLWSKFRRASTYRIAQAYCLEIIDYIKEHGKIKPVLTEREKNGTMEKYDEDAVCPKCGESMVETKFIRQFGVDLDDLIKRTCDRCEYSWNESPLDAEDK